MRMTMCRRMIATILVIAICCGSIPVTASSDLGLVEDTVIDNTVDKKQKISDELSEKMDEVAASDSKDEKIPVCIWYEDIDDEAVTAEVEKQTGLTIDDLDTSLTMPSDEILNEIATMSLESTDTVSVGCAEEMTAYLNETKAARVYERKITDEYIGAKRDVSKDMIGEKYKKVFADYEMNDNDIIFKSQYAPMVIVKLTKGEIEELEQNSLVVSFDIYENANNDVIAEPEYDTVACLERNNFIKVREEIGLTGQGVTVGMIDNDSPTDAKNNIIYPDRIVVLGETIVDGGSSHGGNSAEIIMGTEGIAPNVSKLYSVAGYAGEDFYKSIESLVKNNLTIINASIGANVVREKVYSQREIWFDYIINKYSLTVMQSAGNGYLEKYDAYGDDYRQVWEPGGCYNVITVGAMNDKETDEETDDQGFYYNSYDIYDSKNNKGGCEKPDVLAPANVGLGGTSSAAPVVTGLVALMVELKPSLSAHPQIIKAILMASCHRKVLDQFTGTQLEEMEDGLTEKQGAGVIDPYIAICIVGNKQYGIRDLAGASEQINIIQPKYKAANMNVSMAWFQENVTPGPDEFSWSGVTSSDVNDLALFLYEEDATIPILSQNENSSTEMIYVPLNGISKRYRIEVYGDASSSNPVTFAYAWSTDKMYYQVPTNEGIYRFKNVGSKLYLDVNSSGELIQNSFASTLSQEWAIVKSTETSSLGDLYTLTTDGYTGYAGDGTTISSTNTYAAMQQTPLSMGMLGNEKSIFLYRQLNSYSSSLLLLQPYEGATTSGSKAYWSLTNGTDAQKWYLEKVNYCKGDMDKDGVLESEDANFIQQYIVNLVSFTEVQKYLADVNDDGEITVADANKVLQRVVELE